MGGLCPRPSALAALPLFGLFAGPGALAQERWVVRADVVHTAAGEPIEDGAVLVEDGRIAAVGKSGDFDADDAEVLEARAVTPGLIDLSAQIDTRDFSVEQSSEAAIEYSAVDSIDPFSYRWDRELRSGVTAVLVTPYDLNVFGGRGVVVKTGGEPLAESRLVKDDAVLAAAVGTQPSSGNRAPRGTAPRSFYYRRPTTRMGVEWFFRDTYYDLLNAREGGPEGNQTEGNEAEGDQAEGEEVEAVEAERRAFLERTLTGDLPLFVKAPGTQDVRTAIFLKEEFGIPRMILHHAAEAWREPKLVQRSGVAVVLPPFPKEGRVPDGFVNDTYFLPLDAAAKLHELGVPLALSGHGERDPAARLALQPGFAMRGGLPFDAALRAVTIEPARLVGVGERLGSLEVGKDADLVLWSGEPFQPTSGIVGVLLDGRLAVDPRERE